MNQHHSKKILKMFISYDSCERNMAYLIGHLLLFIFYCSQGKEREWGKKRNGDFIIQNLTRVLSRFQKDLHSSKTIFRYSVIALFSFFIVGSISACKLTFRTNTSVGISIDIFYLYIWIGPPSFSEILCLKGKLLALREKCQYLELFWSIFSRTWTEYGKILCISPYSVRMRENADQNNSKYGHFSRSVALWYLPFIRTFLLTFWK